MPSGCRRVSLALSVLLLGSACATSTSLPAAGPSPSPSPTQSAEAAELVRFSAVYSAQETTIHSDIAQFVQVTQSAGNRAIWSAAGNVATEIDSGDATIVATPHPADLQAALDKLVRGDRELTDGLRAIVHNLQPYNMAVRDVITQAISYRDGLAQDFSRQLAAEMRALGLSPPPSPF